MRDQEYTDEGSELLIKCKERHGKVTMTVFSEERIFPPSGLILKRFESWREAKKQAGLEVSEEYDDEEIMAMLRRCLERCS